MYMLAFEGTGLVASETFVASFGSRGTRQSTNLQSLESGTDSLDFSVIWVEWKELLAFVADMHALAMSSLTKPKHSWLQRLLRQAGTVQ